MRGSEFDEVEFFRAIYTGGSRALLIGRRALVLMGLPVLTADYDFWLHIDDIEKFNKSLEASGLFPNHDPAQARRHGRYVLENDERVDVLVARSVPTLGLATAEFDPIWGRRQRIELAPGVQVHIPSLDDLITTKRFAARPKDLEDIRLLELLRREGLS